MLRISSILLSLSLALPSLVVSGPVVGSLLDAKTDSYIVTLRSGNALSDFLSGLRSTITAQGGAGSINYEYKIINGFSGVFSGSILDLIKNAPQIEAIYPDTVMRTLDLQAGNADWGLQRISQKGKLSRNDPTVTNYDYSYKQPDGAGTFIYVIDTGVRDTHTDFGGRAKLVAQFGGYELRDGNGHGTHCSGTAGGTRWGVAKNAQIRGVKVLSDEGSGSTSDIIAGIDYVVQQYRASGYAPTVASMSLGGTRNLALDQAVSSAVASGVHFAVAAGNSNQDACLTSPAAATAANTIGATDINDARAYYSNYGRCVDVFAPGSNITSTWNRSDTDTNRISGTSMATPHVAGLIAYYLSQQNISTTAMSDKLKSTATNGALALNPGLIDGLLSPSPNLLIYNGGA